MGLISRALIREDTSRCLPKVKGWGHMLGQVTGVEAGGSQCKTTGGHCSLGWKEGACERGTAHRVGITALILQTRSPGREFSTVARAT